MAMTAIATFRTTPETKQRVENLAKRTKKSTSFYYNRAIEQYMEDLEDIYDSLQVMQDIKEGKEETIPLEKLMLEYGLLE